MGGFKLESHFGWVDYASENKEKMINVMKLFEEKGTRDELGIGTIRDAFSNYFFPGTSTIQTRARYFLFVPWIYKKIENEKFTYPEVATRARENEIKLIYALLKAEDENGLIGSDAKKDLKRLPSEIYWSGLYSWGIRMFNGSRSQYHRLLTSDYYDDDIEIYTEGHKKVWDPGLPDPPDNFLKKSSLALRRIDAEYLIDKISVNHEGTLLFYLVNEEIQPNTRFFWELPIKSDLPKELNENIKHAKNFTETIHGAALFYNYLLAYKKENDDLINKYRNNLFDWIDDITMRWDELLNWYNNIEEFWNSKVIIEGNIKRPTRNFVEEWYSIIFQGKNIKNIINNNAAKSLLKNREIRLKGKRARLSNKKALERWGGASGTSKLKYRWGTVKVIIQDILDGLKKGD